MSSSFSHGNRDNRNFGSNEGHDSRHSGGYSSEARRYAGGEVRQYGGERIGGEARQYGEVRTGGEARQYGGERRQILGGYEERSQGNAYAIPGNVRRGYPPITLRPVKAYPPDPFIDQYTLPEALMTGTLFRWLHDPYVNPYRE